MTDKTRTEYFTEVRNNHTIVCRNYGHMDGNTSTHLNTFKINFRSDGEGSLVINTIATRCGIMAYRIDNNTTVSVTVMDSDIEVSHIPASIQLSPK